MFRIGTQELLLVLALALLIFGPTKLPKLGKAIGRTLGNFKRGLSAAERDGDEAEQENA